MKNDRFKQTAVIVLPFALLAIALYLLFRQSWQQILLQLQQVQPGWFALMLALSGAYYLIDARSFQMVVKVLAAGFFAERCYRFDRYGTFYECLHLRSRYQAGASAVSA